MADKKKETTFKIIRSSDPESNHAQQDPEKGQLAESFWHRLRFGELNGADILYACTGLAIVLISISLAITIPVLAFRGQINIQKTGYISLLSVLAILFGKSIQKIFKSIP